MQLYLWLQDHYLWIYTWDYCHIYRKFIWYYTHIWNIFCIIFWFIIWSSYNFTNRYWVLWKPCWSDWPVFWNTCFFSRNYRTDLWYYNHSYWTVIWNTWCGTGRKYFLWKCSNACRTDRFIFWNTCYSHRINVRNPIYNHRPDRVFFWHNSCAVIWNPYYYCTINRVNFWNP